MQGPSTDNNIFYGAGNNFTGRLWLAPVVLIAVFLGWLIAGKGFSIAALLLVFPFITGWVILIFLYPRVGLASFIVYSFIMPALGRHIDGIPFGLGVDGLLLLTWLGVIFYREKKYQFRRLNNDLVWLAVTWFILTVLEIGNPERPNIIGWLQEMRSATLYWVLTVPLTMMVFNKKSDIRFFLDIIIFLSFLGALYGTKQLYMGVDAAESRWLAAGAYKTHILFGKLRVFSYYSEAGQFGASQAQLAIMCLILAIGPHGTLRKLCYGVAGLFIFYGMLISGTRGALAGIVGGGFIFLVLSKQLKILVVGSVLGLGFLGMLKYTTVGNQYDQIVRLRSSLDPSDPSLQVRLINQQKLKAVLSSKPFGTGVGTIGEWGTTYNSHIYSSAIPPDSLYVKIWAMYGITGFILWFGIMMYILGKSAGIIWNTRDPVLRNQLCALCAGAGGILFCSYGNEVMNALPSSAIVYVSWALIWMSTRWDTPILKPVES